VKGFVGFFFWSSCSFLGKKKKENKRKEKAKSGFDVGGCRKKKGWHLPLKVSLPSMGVQVLLQVAQEWAQTKMTSYLHHPPESNPM